MASPENANQVDDNDDDIRNNESAVKRPCPEPEEVVEDEEILKQIDGSYFHFDQEFDVRHYQLKVGV